jgi:hypothetical protein
VYNSISNSFNLRQLDYALRVNHSRERPPRKTPGLSLPPDDPASIGQERRHGHKVASKRPPKRSPVHGNQKNENGDDDDDDLLGALANELEESLEDDSNDAANDKGVSKSNGNEALLPAPDFSESSDEDDVLPNRVQIIERNRESPKPRSFSSPAQMPRGSGPVSLRGLASGRRVEEDDLSSSEEE